VCPEGKIPSLASGNHELWGLFNLMLPGLTRESGYDYSAIQVVFDIQGIEQARRPAILRRIVALIDVLDKAKRERRANAS